jgi:hypothetical protein
MANQFQTPTFPTIAVPDAEVKSLQTTVMALKQCVEMLTGVDQPSKGGSEANRFAPHVFIQNDPPSAYLPGDLWVCTAKSYSFNVWDGTRWLLVATIPHQ